MENIIAERFSVFQTAVAMETEYKDCIETWQNCWSGNSKIDSFQVNWIR